MTNVIKYGLNQLPESREWFRLVNGAVNTLQDYGIENLSVLNIGPIGVLAKGIDGAYYGKKALEDIDAVIIAVKKFDGNNKKDTCITIFNATIKCAGDSFATLKWLGAIGGVVILAPHAKKFGHVKNICSVYSATIGIVSAGKTIWAQYNTDLNGKGDRRKNVEAAVTLTACLCSAWLNGMGGLGSWVGGSAAPWTYNAAIILSTTALVAGKVAAASPA